MTAAIYNNPAIQQTYNRYYTAGMPGMLANANESVGFKQELANNDITPGFDLYPGQFVFYDAALNSWNNTNPDPTVFTHIVALESGASSTAIANPTTNQNSEIVYVTGTSLVPAWSKGEVYVQAGATFLRGDRLQYDDTAGTNGRGAVVPIVDPTLAHKLVILALEDGALDEVVKVSIARIA